MSADALASSASAVPRQVVAGMENKGGLRPRILLQVGNRQTCAGRDSLFAEVSPRTLPGEFQTCADCLGYSRLRRSPAF